MSEHPSESWASLLSLPVTYTIIMGNGRSRIAPHIVVTSYGQYRSISDKINIIYRYLLRVSKAIEVSSSSHIYVVSTTFKQL